MAYRPPVSSSIILAAGSAETANLSNLCIVTTHTYFAERQRPYNSIDEVNSDPALPKTSVAYRMLSQAFKQTGVPAPVILGRRKANDITLTPDPILNSANYSLIITVVDDATNTPVTSVVSITSDSDATEEEIATAIFTDMTVTSPVANVTVTDETGAVKIVPAAGYSFSITNITNLVDTYTTTETAPDLYAALVEEADSSFYFITCDDNSETFMKAMADVIEATETSLNPKMHMVFTNEANTLTPLADPATDLFGKMKEEGYTRTAGFWNDESDSYPNITAPAFNGQAIGGTTVWTAMTPQSGLSVASDPVTGKELSTAKQGYITDRNCSHWNNFKGVSRQFGGKTFSGEWIDTIRAKDYLNDQIIVKLTNLLNNVPLSKIQFSKGYLVTNAIDSVLQNGYNLGILDGFEPAQLPQNITFEDQVERILQQVKWTGYLASAIDAIVVSGKLTYRED